MEENQNQELNNVETNVNETDNQENNENVIDNQEIKNVKEKKKFKINLPNPFSLVKNILPKKKVEEDVELDVDKNAVSSDTFEKKELSEEDKKAQEAAKNELEEKAEKKKKLIKKVFTIVIIAVVIIAAILIFSKIKKKQENKKDLMKNVATAKTMTIASELSGSGTLSPKDSYNITSLVEGNVTYADFEVGEKVNKDQLLIVIDSGSAYRNISNASSSLAQAKDNFEKAKLDFEKLETDFENNMYHSQIDGTIKMLNIKAGDIINGSTEIGTITNDSKMTIKVPFLSEEANLIGTKSEAVMVLTDTDETFKGTIVNIDKNPQTYKTGAQVKYVKVDFDNPGGLTPGRTALVYAGGHFSMADGTCEVYQEEKITLGDGSNIEIEEIIAGEGTYVKKGDPIFKITDKTIVNATSGRKSSYLSAEASFQKAQSSLEDAYDDFDEYNIKAPIDGTVIKKDVKVGDKIQKNSNGNTTLAVIYDLSELSFDMDVDELDISKVKVGQEVTVEADAFAGKTFKGKITEVSLVAANSNGVTNYPVTVTITDTGELLPGMNVDSYVTLAKSENCIGVPANALQRGNVIYVLNESPTIKEKKYSNENISDRIKNNTPEGFTAVKVEVGVTNENFIEIKSGLQDGDQVYVNASSQNQFGFPGMSGGMRPGGMGGGMRPGGMGR